MNSHGGNIAILGFATGVVLLSLGCASAVAEKPRETQKTEAASTIRSCAVDRNCPFGFCDRGSCVALAGESNFGGPCNSLPPAWTGESGQPDAQCGGFLCVDRRCRSCVMDAECLDYFGAGTCAIAAPRLVGHGRGPLIGGAMECRLPTVRDRHRDSEWISSQLCANVGPDIPVEKRLAAGKACDRDCDCRSGFCDRGTCADGADIGAWNYGKGWCGPGPPVPPFENELSIDGRSMCAGYVCIDQRCRSCVSDAECQVARKEYRCLSLYDLPGKRCGWPGEATLGPAPTRMGPPQPLRPPDYYPEE